MNSPASLSRTRAMLFAGLMFLGACEAGTAGQLNGFELSYATIPRAEILHGGPPRDGIPALVKPRVVSAADAKYLSPRDPVIGVVFAGKARAYPLRILVYHEIANDVVGGRHVAITYCPLCNSALVFDRNIAGRVHEFGVSGLLWNSNVLMYDREASGRFSLWSQVLMKAVTGPAARAKHELKLLPGELTTWGDWRKRRPNTTVLSLNTGHRRDYSRLPYGAYFRTDRLIFPVRRNGRRPAGVRNKDMYIVVHLNGARRAYRIKDVRARAGAKGYVRDRVGGAIIHLEVDNGDSVIARNPGRDAKQPAVAYMFWFVLNAVLPDVPIWKP